MSNTIKDFIRAADNLPNGRVRVGAYGYEVELGKTLRGYYYACLYEYDNDIRGQLIGLGYGVTRAAALYELKKDVLK